MEMTKTTKARLATVAATAVNATVAATLFDSKAIAAYHLVTGGIQTAMTEVPDDFEYGNKEMAIHTGSMLAGGTLASSLLKVVGMAIDKATLPEEDEATTEEVNQLITELTGLENPEEA